ncbi:MFS transporter, partial [Halorubrum sp. SD626R]|uniref:MFS transporter n=1 Tax=Halorubrum sp. SD626R TaxID=1419722 RepID=UPI0010F6CAF0
LAFAPVFPAFVLVAVLLGLAAGLHYAVATTLLSRTFDELGTAVGLHSVGGPLAGLTAPVAAAWIGVRYGWRPAVALAAVVRVPVFVLFVRGVRPTEPRRPDQPMRDRLKLAPLVELLSRPAILLPLFVAMIGTYVVQGVMSFLPTFLVAFRDYSPGTAAATFSAFFVVRTVAQVATGKAADRFGRDAGIGISIAAGAVGAAGFVAVPGVAGVALGVVGAGLGSSFFSAIDPRFMDALSDTERGAGFGLVRTVYTVVGSTGSFGVGLAADLFGWGVSFALLSGLYVVALAVLVGNKLLGTGVLKRHSMERNPRRVPVSSSSAVCRSTTGRRRFASSTTDPRRSARLYNRSFATSRSTASRSRSALAA